jgi:type VI secretion system protein ImpL
MGGFYVYSLEIMVLVISALGLAVYFRQQRKQPKTQEAADPEIETVIREAQTRLAQTAGRDAKLIQLPVFFIVGETGSAKTSTIIHSGIEPDLLAGQVYQDSIVTPTRPANIWLAQKSAFVEVGGTLLSDPDRWAELVKSFSPAKRWWQIFDRKPQAPRAVIVCVEAEAFLKPNADEAMAIVSRNLHTRVDEISQSLGVRLPMYVLFTKLDRLAFFIDFVSNLNDEEATHMLGVTLPLRGDREPGGVYAEEESRRLTAAFDELFHSLCDKRSSFLARENGAAKLPAVYEFPSEFHKLRNAVVRFLVDLGRPSQLRAKPFLRGFYFSGVRPLVLHDSAPGESGRTRRVPQWLFLGHLFSDVLLPDRAALGSTGQSAHKELFRCILIATAGGLLLLWASMLTISFFGDRALENRVSDAVNGIRSYEMGGAAQELPSVDALQRLDNLRESVELLLKYGREGAAAMTHKPLHDPIDYAVAVLGRRGLGNCVSVSEVAR